ncbi:hypothetical protein [Puniceibacterium sediminis]|uniref:Uncharacterized protein n=1 Tax=Puniceibacterium sediminis TaxID=1608407 RepID=A0A238WDV5_9RHOB|nr:hypothetical protein [Puniceibacterium sediminis]SNR44541.1 hypothetical protein SAMN06265370_105125 [Puniceibacterium sediminis]
MDKVIDHYNALTKTAILPDLRLNLSSRAVKQTPRLVEGQVALLAALARFGGDGWLECVDAVRYRTDGDTHWISPTTNQHASLSSDVRILNGEVTGVVDGFVGSLQIRHHHLETWHLTEILETGNEMPSFDGVFRGIIRDNPKSPESDGLDDLRYRTFWDVEKGSPYAVRFVGFVKSGGQRDE